MTVHPDNFTIEQFLDMPVVAEGESKIIRYAGNGLCLTLLKPTVYSFTQNRCGMVKGTDRTRLRCTKVFLELMDMVGIPHSYISVGKQFILSHLMLEEPWTGNPDPFVPEDIDPSTCKKVPPIEVIVKRFHTGTTKHDMYNMAGSKVRDTHPLFPGFAIESDCPYPMPMVRFDWRNPLLDNDGKRLADKALSRDMASWWIDTEKAAWLVRRAYHAMSDFLAFCDILCYDVCMFVTTDGSTMYGELSPDCGRFRHFFQGSLDKDVWRSGGSNEEVLKKWSLMADILEEKWPVYKQTIDKDTFVTLPAEGQATIHIGTTNNYKVAEIASEMSPFAHRFRLAPEDDIEETGKTFVENAIIKAKGYARLAGGITIAEDSGLVVEGLGGLPGIHSARFSDCTINDRSMTVTSYTPSDTKRDVIDSRNRKMVLDLLDDPRDNGPRFRKAKFVCAIAVCDGNGNVMFTCQGESHGTIADQESGKGGFGYDSIFVGEDTGGATYAELDPFRKNLRSHRTKALRELRRWMEANNL